MAQAPYPPQGGMIVDNLAATAQDTLEALQQVPSMTYFIASRQRITLVRLLETVQHPAAPLLLMYVD